MDSLQQSPHPLADSDSQYLDCQGFRVHYKRYGTGPRLLLLLHGSFMSMRSWRSVIAPLARENTVVVFDRPVFGLTSRPLPQRQDPHPVSYSAEAQSELVVDLIGQLGFEQAVLIGNSTGGTLALMAALRHPERVSALILVDAMIYSGYATSEIPAFVKPGMRALTPLFSGLMKFMISRLYDKVLRSFWHDPTRLDEATLAAMRADFMHGNWNRAFWEMFLETRHLHLDDHLGRVTMPALVITGEDDRAVKTEESFKLARELPHARIEVLANAAHVPHEEVPEAFVQSVEEFLATLPTS